MRAELTTKLMGSQVQLVVLGSAAAEHLAYGVARLRELEARWSRFRDDSDVSRLNRAHGRPVTVTPDTIELVTRSVRAWQLTGGSFDPTVGASMHAFGYDHDFARTGGPDEPSATAPAPGCADIAVDAVARRVRLPADVRFDAGGIGKGLAADIVAAEILQRGAVGALINVGGDLRAAGEPAEPGGWIVGIDDARRPGRDLFRLALPGGAVATSSTLRRQWRQGSRHCHHLMDPHTGAPALDSWVAVSVIAGEAWWAEAMTKALLLAARPAAHPLAGSVEFVALGADGELVTSPALTGLVAA